MARSTGKLARARIVEPIQPLLVGTRRDELLAALRSGLGDVRYGRIWRVGRIYEFPGHLHGRLGVEKAVEADLWDDDAQDFKPTAVRDGLASPFVIRLSDLAVVFQIRAPRIRVASFTGALKAILNRGRSGAKAERWDVSPLTGETSFEDWVADVDYVTRVRFRVADRPYPPPPSNALSQMILSTQPDVAHLEMRARNGLDTGVPIVQEILRYAEGGFGEVVAVGKQDDSRGVERVWVSTLKGESQLTAVEVTAETREASREVLMAELPDDMGKAA